MCNYIDTDKPKTNGRINENISGYSNRIKG
jgi:hypothetical protein